MENLWIDAAGGSTSSEEALLEGTRPIDLVTTLLSLIDCALADQIRPAIAALEQAASLGDPP